MSTPFPEPRPYFIMKLVNGSSLRDLLQGRSGPGHDLPRFVAIFEQVCQTVGYAHSRSIIHRDLKPANVMVGARAGRGENVAPGPLPRSGGL